MKFFYSFILFFILFSSTFAQEDSAFPTELEIESLLNNLAQEKAAMNELFDQNRGNLSSILTALNKHNLEDAARMQTQMQQEIAKMKLEQERQINFTNADNEQQQAIQEFLNQQPHVLFDESESDQASDPVPEDEQNEIVLAQVNKINMIFLSYGLNKVLHQSFCEFDSTCFLFEETLRIRFIKC